MVLDGYFIKAYCKGLLGKVPQNYKYKLIIYTEEDGQIV